MTDPVEATLADDDLLEIAGWRPSVRARRAESLAQLVLADPAVAAPLRSLVRDAARGADAENAQISIVSTRQIGIVAERGPRAGSVSPPPTGVNTSLEDTVCAVSVRADAPICIPDARLDDRVASLPAVTQGIVGAYLGSPLRTDEGAVIGVLCVYDAGPHDWTPAQRSALDVIAGRVSDALDRLGTTAAPATTVSAS